VGDGVADGVAAGAFVRDWSGAFEPEAPVFESVVAVGDFFGVALGVGLGLGGAAVTPGIAPPAPAGVGKPAPVLGGFFVSAPDLLGAEPGVAVAVPVAGRFGEPVAGAVVPVPTGGAFNGLGAGFAAAVPLSGGFCPAIPGFCSVAAPAGLGVLTGVGDGDAVAAGAPVVVPPGTFGAFGSCLGTLGNLCERMSAARMGAGPANGCVSSVIFVIISTSSSRLRLAAGLILMARNGSLSLSGVDEITVPTAYPLG
jgi:hypothetical protein